MSKENGSFTKSLIESNEIFSELAKSLQNQIDKVSQRLQGLEQALLSSRSELKNKNTEILRLREIIKSYEKDRETLSKSSDSEIVNNILPQLKELTDSISIIKKAFPQEGVSDSTVSSARESDFTNLIEELEQKKLLIQNLELENNDLKEEERLLQSKIEVLELKVEESSKKIPEEDDTLSLKNEVSKYIKENISLHEKISSNDALQNENSALKDQVAQLEEENNLFQKTINYKEEREKELLAQVSKLHELEEEAKVYQKTINYKEEREKELLAQVKKLQELEEEANVYQKTINYKEEREKELLAQVEKLEELEEEAKVFQKTINYKEDREKELLMVLENLKNDNSSLKNMISDLEEESKIFQQTINYKEEKEKELQAKIHTFEDQLSNGSTMKVDLAEELNNLRNQLHEKEEELINAKLQANQLEETENQIAETVFDEQTVDVSDKFPSHTESEDDLLLKISEMEMEEANWQDEKKILLSTVENLKKSLSESGNNSSFGEDMNQTQSLIKSLRSEIDELHQDIDEADSEIKELELENNILKEKLTELEASSSENPSLNDLQTNQTTEESSNFEYELQQKTYELNELQTRLKSQEQQIVHLENLMEQEHQLREKFEFLFNNLRSKTDQKEVQKQEDNIEAKKQLEQVLKSLNQETDIMKMSTSDDEEETSKHSSSNDLSRALENANLYVSLIDKFLKPHVQVTQLLKQGQWEINSLAEIVGMDRKGLLEVLEDLKTKKVLDYDQSTVWRLESS